MTAGGPPPALEPGAAFPDLDLPDHNGAPRRLSELVAGDPTVVQFFRGWWCPKEQAYFRRLVALQDELEVAYTGLVSISVDPPLVQSAFRAGIGARWTFLSDEARTWQERLGLREVTDTINKPYLPVVCVVSPGLTIHSAYNGYWFWGRPTNEELRRDLRAASQAVRPDWDPPAAPGAPLGSPA